MTTRKHFYLNAGLVRNKLNFAAEKADQLHADEDFLVDLLYEIDLNHYYVRYGYKSLTGFCNHALRFSKTQSQRIVTRVRRYDPTSNIGRKSKEDDGG